MDMEGHTAEQLYNALIDFFSKHDNIADCRGQSYDNAINMIEKYNGLQAKIKELNSYAEYTMMLKTAFFEDDAKNS